MTNMTNSCPLDSTTWGAAAVLGRLDWLEHWHAQGLLEQPLVFRPGPEASLEAYRKVLPAMVCIYEGRTALEVALHSNQGEYALALLDLMGPAFPKYFGPGCTTLPFQRSPEAESPLELAIRLPDDSLSLRLVERLVEQGHCLDTDWVVKSPLEWAIEDNRPGRVRSLLQAGATIQAASQPRAPLFLATDLLLPRVAEVLLEAGADVNAQEQTAGDDHPYTVLMRAAKAWQQPDYPKARDLVALLVQHGADPDTVVLDANRNDLEMRALNFVPSALHALFQEDVGRGKQARLEQRVEQAAKQTTMPRM